MKLALNYSPQAEELVVAGEIVIDLFKCPPWDDLVAQARRHRPVYIHFPLTAGDQSLATSDWGAVETMLSQTDTPYINVHLEAREDDFPGVPATTTDPAHGERVAELLIQDVSSVVERFGAERVIVENVICRGAEGKVLRPVVEPAVIRQVTAATGCGFLLDIAHARMTAIYLGWDVHTYIAQLPVDRVRELHITGIQHDGQRWRDSMPMGDADWQLAAWVLSHMATGAWCEPSVVALEYGGVGPKFAWRTDASVLQQQVPQLLRLIQNPHAGPGAPGPT